MFGNFIYFILVLLIYLTYQPAEETNFSGLESISLFILLTLFFFYLTRQQFKRVEKFSGNIGFSLLDNKFQATLLRQSIIAILLFAIDIYGLNLPNFLAHLDLFAAIPTLQALLFLGLFIGYLAIVWFTAHPAYQKLYRTDLSRKSYVVSNITFSIPVLIPWLCLSGIADILNVLPFQLPKEFLATSEGQAFYFFFFLVVIAILGPWMMQKFWRCKPLEEGGHRSRIASLCQRADMMYADILYWPIFGGRMLTAGVMGLIKRFRYILVTPSLLKLLEPEEVDAVIAHEIGHIKKYHLVFYLLFFVGYLLLSFVTFDVIVYAILFADPVYWLVNQSGFRQTTVVSAIFSIVTITVFLIYFRFIFGYYMRNFERQADTFVYTLFDTARPLISTLEKISATSGQSPDRPNWHHFSISERMDYLFKCEGNSTWIARHDRKVKKSIIIYLFAMVMVGIIGYQLNIGSVGNRISDHFFEKVILKELENKPVDANLFNMLGDLYYNRKDYLGVRNSYEKALALEPTNPHTLNNLAWLLATCENENFRDPVRALELARRAAELEQSPHILDTLAESLFANGRALEAIEVEERALAIAKSDRSIYIKQLRRFKESLE